MRKGRVIKGVDHVRQDRLDHRIRAATACFLLGALRPSGLLSALRWARVNLGEASPEEAEDRASIEPV